MRRMVVGEIEERGAVDFSWKRRRREKGRRVRMDWNGMLKTGGRMGWVEGVGYFVYGERAAEATGSVRGSLA